MLLPIVRLPTIVEELAPRFDSVFATPEQRKHFREYVTGLIAGDNATVEAINSLFLERNDQSALNKFLTQASWDEEELNRLRVKLEMERLNRRPVSAAAGRLIIDDTLAHHTRSRQRMEWLAKLWDHTAGRYVWAHDVVTSFYVNRADQFPVDFRLYHQFQEKKERATLRVAVQALTAEPELDGYRAHLVNLLIYRLRQQIYRPKTALGAELVRGAVALGLPFSVVLFDGWFTRCDLIDVIEAADKDWIGGCPKDRLVLWQPGWIQLQAFLRTIPATAYRPTVVHDTCYWTFSRVLAMKALRRRRFRIVASYRHPDLKGEPRLLVTNRLDWNAARILLTFSDRWPTETFNEDNKGHLGFEDYQLRKLRGIRRHWYLGFVAYTLLGDQGQPGRSRQGVHAPFESTGQRRRAVVNELLGHLVDWIARQLEEGVPPSTITQMLLA